MTLCFAIEQLPAAPPAAIPEASRELLQQNAKALDGLEFTITVDHRFVADVSTLPDELRPLATKGMLSAEENLVRIDGPHFYDRSSQGPQGTKIGERSFDGRVLYSGRPPGADEESLLTIDSIERCNNDAKQTGFPVKHFFWRYFEDAGYRLPEYPGECGESSSSLVLSLARRGRVISWLENPTTGMHEVVLEAPDPWSQVKMTPQQIKNAVSHLLGKSRDYQEGVLQRLVARSKTHPFRKYRLSLDPKLNFAVKEKREETTTGELLSYCVCEDFFKLSNRETWLPKACRTSVYACESSPAYISSTPLYEVTAILKQAVPKVFSDKDFELWYDKPGGAVFDYTAKDATFDRPVIYRVPASAAELARSSKGQVAGVSRTRWLIIINAAILAAFLIYLIRRRGARSQRSQ